VSLAARGRGVIRSSLGRNDTGCSAVGDARLYCSAAKVVLVGSGADEQLGGYGRHRSVFAHRSWHGLQAELETDLYRIWARNLGRDDRVISDHGREARFPFLSENVVRFLANVPLHHVCNLHRPPGIGDKMILRDAARLLGLTASCTLAKRAIQFGSRVGKDFSAGGKADGSANFVLPCFPESQHFLTDVT